MQLHAAAVACCTTKLSAASAVSHVNAASSTGFYAESTAASNFWHYCNNRHPPVRYLKIRLPHCALQVPILRNRQRLFLFGESPWDSFGPEPPPGAIEDMYSQSQL